MGYPCHLCTSSSCCLIWDVGVWWAHQYDAASFPLPYGLGHPINWKRMVVIWGASTCDYRDSPKTLRTMGILFKRLRDVAVSIRYYKNTYSTPCLTVNGIPQFDRGWSRVGNPHLMVLWNNPIALRTTASSLSGWGMFQRPFVNINCDVVVVHPSLTVDGIPQLDRGW